jgi:hypothetical protein
VCPARGSREATSPLSALLALRCARALPEVDLWWLRLVVLDEDDDGEDTCVAAVVVAAAATAGALEDVIGLDESVPLAAVDADEEVEVEVEEEVVVVVVVAAAGEVTKVVDAEGDGVAAAEEEARAASRWSRAADERLSVEEASDLRGRPGERGLLLCRSSSDEERCGERVS